jgi:signal transduction histidine kinase
MAWLSKTSKGISFIWGFIKHHPSVIYSILLIIVVPVIMVGYAIWIISSYQSVVEVGLQRQAMVVHQLLETFIDVDSLEISEQQIEQVQKVAGDDIIDFTILQREEASGQFTPVVGFENSLLFDSVYTSTQYALAWTEDSSFATIANHPSSNERVLLITKPIRNKIGERWGLATLVLSLAQHDQLVSSILTKSSIFLIVGILIILLLVANHFRLFNYATELEHHTEMDKVRDDFISVASHELRTPITGIRSFLSLVEEGGFGQLNEDGNKYVKKALSQSDKLNALVDHMLDVSRIEQGRLEYDYKIINPGPTVSEVIDQLIHKAQGKGLKLIIDGSTERLINVDPDHFRRIITNLVGNSIKYTNKGEVAVNIKDKRAGQVAIIVKDTGMGIPPEEVETLFRKFSRVHSDETAKVQGTGLGLWITKALVEKMGGKIYLASIHGQGSEFTVIFPEAKNIKK